jgi:cysteine synthase B
MVKDLARREGLLVGISSGGNVWAARKIGCEMAERGETGAIVTILSDGADKYLSEHFWDLSDQKKEQA